MRIDRHTCIAAVVVPLALSVVSCAKVTGGDSPSGDNAGVTSAGPGTTASSGPSSVSNVGTQTIAMPAGTNPDNGLAAPPRDEIPVAPPSPAVLQAVSAAETRLAAVTAGFEGTRVRFVDCTENASCSARLEAPSLSGLRDLLQAVSAQQGGIGYVAREQLDAYTGRTFVADVTLGGPDTRPVPTDENELLPN
jgi:hypothetical protein